VDPPEESVGVGVGLALALGRLVEAAGEGAGEGVESAREVVELKNRRRTAKAVPTFGVSADPKGLTLSSIRRKSLCMLDRSGIFLGRD